MLTVFDGANGHPILNDDYYIRELASGYDEIIFNINIRDEVYQYIKEEATIRDRDLNEYIIKQIDAGDKTAKVVAQINLDAWKSELHMNYSNNSATVGATVLGILPQGWGLLDYSGVIKRRTVPPSDKTKDYNVTALQILEDCATTYEVRFRFNTKNKTITIVNPSAYESRGAFATRDLNLVKLNYKGKSDSFVTRLYAEGADGLTFATINDGKSYVENRTYADKVISAFWKDDRYTDKASLLDEANRKIAEMGVPTQSYNCDILDLANTNPDIYGFEDFGLFEVVTLIDDAKKVRTDYQVVERWTYPYYPAKNKVVLSTSTPNIQSAIASISNSINSSTSVFQQMLQNAIINETEMITGNNGGYLVLRDTNDDGTPDELLIMNAPTIETATKVWRWNQAGLGYSENGYNGPYTLGMTMDGAIVADLITAGTFDGTIIRAGSIDAGALSVQAKEELSILHSFLSSDALKDATKWNHGTSTPTNETIDGKTYLVLDGTSLSAWNTNYYVNIPVGLTGTTTAHVHLKYHIDTEVTVPNQRFLFMNFKNSSGVGTQLRKNLGAQTIPANTDFVWETDFQLNDADILQLVPLFGIYYIQGCKTYIEELEITASVDTYAMAGIQVNAQGLSSTVKKADVISSINQSAEQVTISANKIDLSGDLSLRGNFTSYESGTLTGYRLYIDSSSLFIYEGNKLACQLYPMTYGSYDSVALTLMDTKTGRNLCTVGPNGLTTSEKIICSELNVNNNGNISTFYGQVEFLQDVYNSAGGVQFISDRRKKRSIKDLAISKARSFIMGLKPKKFKFTKDISKSNRYHHGFIAQEVKEAMPEDWGLYCENKDLDFVGLRYDEIIADLVAVVQDQQKRIEKLEKLIKTKEKEKKG